MGNEREYVLRPLCIADSSRAAALIRHDFASQGMAGALVARVEAEARANGLPRLLLSTRLVLAGNRRLFAACGFRETAHQAHPGYAHPTFVDMGKPVAQQ